MSRLSELFKKCDVVGRYGRELTEIEAGRISTAFACWLRSDRLNHILVASDLRPGGSQLRAAVVSALQDVRAQIRDLGVVPAPLLQFAERTLGEAAQATIYVTAGRRSPDYNGLRFTRQGWPLMPDDLAQLCQLCDDEPTLLPGGSVEPLNIAADYQHWLINRFAKRVPELSIVLDASHSSWGQLAGRFLSQLGLRITELSEPVVPAGNPVPLERYSAQELARLGEAVRSSGADLGLLFDNDGDRFAVVDERGRPVPETTLAALLLSDVLSDAAPGEAMLRERPWCAEEEPLHKPMGATALEPTLPSARPDETLPRLDRMLVPTGASAPSVASTSLSRPNSARPDSTRPNSARPDTTRPDTTRSNPVGGGGGSSRPAPWVVLDLRCGLALSEAAAAGGAQIDFVRTGVSFLRHRVLARTAVLGLSGVGHIIRGELAGGADALFSALRLITWLASTGNGRPMLSERIAAVPRYCAAPELRLPCLPGECGTVCQSLQLTFSGEEDCLVRTEDGIRLDFPTGWALIRPALDDPDLVVQFEGRTAEDLADLAELVGEQLPTDMASAVREHIANHVAANKS